MAAEPKQAPEAPAADPTVVGGKYRLIAELGHGGMADVYLAVSEGIGGFNKLVVIKQLRNLEDPEFVTMFLDEARLAARLSHPCVVQTFEIGQDGERYFMAMEFLDGPTLHRLRKRLAKAGGVPLPLELHVLSRVLEGLHYAHEARDFDGARLNVVHRDLTPHNVIVTYDGHAKILDFGIAKAVDSVQETRAGVFKGKMTYIPPEQLLGPVDQRADIFSAGVMLFEAVAQRSLWGSQSTMVIGQKLLNGEIPTLAEVKPDAPPELVEICQKAMAFAPEDRFASALEMKAAIDGWLDGQDQQLSPARLGAFVARAFEADRAKMRQVIEAQLGKSTTDVRGGTLPVLSVGSRSGTGPGSTPGHAARNFSNPSVPRVGFNRDGEESTPVSGVSPRPGLTPGRGQALDGPAAEALPPRRWMVPAALGALAVVAVAAGGWWLLRPGPAVPVVSAPQPVPTQAVQAALVPEPEKAPEPAPAPEPAVPEPAVPEPPPEPPKPVRVVMQVKASPAKAQIFLDDQEVGVGEYRVEQDRGQAIHRLRVEAPGYRREEREVTFDQSQTFDLKLERLPEPARVARPVQPAARPKPGPTPAPVPAPAPVAEPAAVAPPSEPAPPTPASPADRELVKPKPKRPKRQLDDADPWK